MHHFPYAHTECFLCSPHHAHVFAPLCALINTSKCKGRVRPLPPQAAVFVEFHSVKVMQFWTLVAPRIEALRAVHEPNGGSVKSMTLLREPRSVIISHYQMWPPTLPVDGPTGRLRMTDATLTPINTYLGDGNLKGAQTFWLVSPRSGFDSGSRWQASAADARECHADFALRRLCAFDHVANISTVNISWIGEVMRTRTTQTIVTSHAAPKGNRVLAQGGQNSSLYRRVLNETSQVREAPALTIGCSARWV